MEGPVRKINTGLSDMEELIRERLASGGSVSFSPKGTSMLPMLRTAGDSVTLAPPPARIKKGTVALFVSKQDEGRSFTLHRLVRIKNGEYYFCGDRCPECDPPVRREDIIGCVSEYVSRGKKRGVNEPWYRFYSFWMVHTSGIRRFSMKVQERIYSLWRRLFRRR
jgi:hypothetical protein